MPSAAHQHCVDTQKSLESSFEEDDNSDWACLFNVHSIQRSTGHVCHQAFSHVFNGMQSFIFWVTPRRNTCRSTLSHLNKLTCLRDGLSEYPEYRFKRQVALEQVFYSFLMHHLTNYITQSFSFSPFNFSTNKKITFTEVTVCAKLILGWVPDSLTGRKLQEVTAHCQEIVWLITPQSNRKLSFLNFNK